MAEPQRKPSGHSAVASCGATECAHNDNRNCTAGEVEVTMQGGHPVCATFKPEKPKARP